MAVPTYDPFENLVEEFNWAVRLYAALFNQTR